VPLPVDRVAVLNKLGYGSCLGQHTVLLVGYAGMSKLAQILKTSSFATAYLT
jgi:hypothetical protein